MQIQLFERQTQLLLESNALGAAANGMILTDREGIIQWVNPAFCALTGFSADEVLGQNPRLLKSDRHDPAFYQSFWGTIRSGQTWRGEFINRRKDGSLSVVEQTVTPVRADGGEINHFIGVMQDVTERKRAEEALRQQAQLLDLTHDPIFVRDMDDCITFWNRGAEELYGWTTATAMRQVSHLLLETKFPKPLEEIKSELQSTGRWEGELIHTTCDGRSRIVSSRWSLQRDKTGTPLSILEIDTDITGRKCAEQTLRQARDLLEGRVQARTTDLQTAIEALMESQDRFRLMAENIRDVFWLATPGMAEFIYVSPAYQEIWGRSSEELYVKPHAWFDAIHPEDQSRSRQYLEKPIDEDGYEQAFRVVRPDGSVRWVRDRGFPVKDDEGRVFRLVGIARDVTDRKKLEQEVLAISEREQRRIGHDLHDDLCQQLVGIEFLSKALEQQLGTPSQAAQAGEIAQLIRDAIEHTRLLARGLAPVDLEAEGLMRGLKALAARTSRVFHIPCSFSCPAPVLIHDAAVGICLYRIAQEAITNSVKHAKAKQMDIRMTATSESAVLTVHDDGLGFCDDAQNPPGMGLRIMQYRAAMAGGTVAIQTQPEGGTSVVCTVPLPASKSVAPAGVC
jgi:PAS domain S-box-containing protein